MDTKFDPKYVHELLVEGNHVDLGQLVEHEKAELAGIPQACVYIALLDGKGSVFIQCRAAAKRLWPSLRTISASGHVNPGENFEGAARRETLEELGISARTLCVVGAFHGESHCGPIFETVAHETPTPNPAEVDVSRSGFVTIDRLKDLVAERPGDFTPTGRRAIEVWLQGRTRV